MQACHTAGLPVSVLHDLVSPAPAAGEQQVDNALLDRFVAGLASAEVRAKAAAPRLPAGQVQMLLMLANRDKKLLEQLGASEQANAVPVCCR